VIALFKSHYSIGKSILTLDTKTKEEGAPDSIFEIVQENGIKRLVLVEDSFMGFLQAQKVSQSLGINFCFGLRVNIVDESADVEDKKTPKHKVVIFAKSDQGCKILFKIYSLIKSNALDAISFKDLTNLWDNKYLDLCIPFYDSFLFSNLFLFNSFVVDINYFEPKFFIESNGLPFDLLLSDAVKNYANKNSHEVINTKSIFYKNRSDFDAFLTYKLICSRSGFASRKSSLEKPNLDHMGSREFCFESFLEHE